MAKILKLVNNMRCIFKAVGTNVVDMAATTPIYIWLQHTAPILKELSLTAIPVFKASYGTYVNLITQGYSIKTTLSDMAQKVLLHSRVQKGVKLHCK